MDAAVRAGGRTVPSAHLTGRAQLAAAADGAAALYGDAGAGGHRQRAEGGGRRVAAVDHGRRRRVDRTGCIKGNKERNAAGDRIIAGRQHTVRDQHDLVLIIALRITDCAVQAVELLAGNVEDRRRAVDKIGRDRHAVIERKRGRRLGGKYAARIVVRDPPCEAITGGRCRRERKSLGRFLRDRPVGSDRRVVNGVAAVFGGYEGDRHILFGDQLQIGEHHRRRFFLGSTRLDIDRYRIIGVQNEGIGPGCGVRAVDLDHAAVQRRRRGEGQRRLAAAGVRQCQRSLRRRIRCSGAAGAGRSLD